jgi:ABC-type bacteriocin/lantibiotic exporter with double-glycine peptidase domain
MLMAGIIVCILGLMNKYDIKTLTITMIIVLAIFFILGTIIQKIMNRLYAQVDKREKEKKINELNKNLDKINNIDDDNEEIEENNEPVEDDKID